jgi:hypothetical protein
VSQALLQQVQGNAASPLKSCRQSDLQCSRSMQRQRAEDPFKPVQGLLGMMMMMMDWVMHRQGLAAVAANRCGCVSSQPVQG